VHRKISDTPAQELTSNLVVRKLLRLIGRIKAGESEQVKVPLVGVLLKLADLQSWLNPKLVDASHDGKGALSGLQRRLPCGDVFDPVGKQRR
jgi:hypothetical protein